jgi:prepilin-type processing-associated H-X9-DG protein
VWRTFDPTGRIQDEGVFQTNTGTQFRSITDGLSSTLMVAEVKAYMPYIRNGATNEETPPASPAEVCSLPSGEFKSESGHTEWVDGRVHQSGFTATFPPNTRVACPESDDLDWTATREGLHDTERTYSVVTARSYHAGVVNVAMADGSIHAVNGDVDLLVWRAMGTRNGQEAVAQR